MLDVAGVAANRLRIEIGQLDELLDNDALAPSVGALQDRGTAITLDNYGLGTHGLNMRRRLAVDALKVDRSFVVGKRGSLPDEQALRAMAALAKGCGCARPRRGPRNAATCDLLAPVGFDVVQGQHLARPVPLFELASELRRLGAASWNAEVRHWGRNPHPRLPEALATVGRRAPASGPRTQPVQGRPDVDRLRAT